MHNYSEYIPFNMTVYEYFKENSEKYSELTAIDFYGYKLTYRGLFEKILEAERALRAYGIKENDVVALSLPGMPEAIYLIYAINKIGAVYCAFDCRSRKEEIRSTLETFKPRLCIVPDFQVNELAEFKSCQIVYISPIFSLQGKHHFISDFCDFFRGRTFLKHKKRNIMSFKEFMAYESRGENLPAQRSKNDIFGYFYTSGTTYGRKSIILTNENVNSSVYQSGDRECDAMPKDVLLNIMPLFTCYGFTVATHLPLSRGLKIALIPLVKPKNLKKIILKEKPNVLITVPAHWEYFIRERFEGCDLSFINTIIVGGDSVNPNFEDKLNSILKNGGSRAWLRSAYGLSETTSSGTSPVPGTPKGSIGIPLKNTKVGIFDTDTLEVLPSNTKGEICIFSPSVCQGYYNEPELTEKLLRKHKDGKTWLHSGDIGYLDDMGNLFFCERSKRMYVRFDGTKISPYSIEQQLLTCPVVERCMITAVDDRKHSHGKCAKAHIVLKNGISKKYGTKAVNEFIKNTLPQHMIPEQTVIVDKLSYTKNGKLDYFSSSK